MPIRDFNAETFVGFLDISGFKSMMREDAKASAALDNLYRQGYRAVRDSRNVEGIFVSDSGVLFVRSFSNQLDGLKSVLGAIRKISLGMLRKHLLLTASVAYGPFRYRDKIELVGIRKAWIYGGAYVHAFLDNRNKRPKIRPGQCRILSESALLDPMSPRFQRDPILQLVRRRKGDRTRLYYYWMLSDSSEIQQFERSYRAVNVRDYEGTTRLLRQFVRNTRT